MDILRKEEGRRRRGGGEGEKRGKKCSLSLGCPFCHPISYASGLCLCREGEGERGGGGVAVWGRLITSDL